MRARVCKEMTCFTPIHAWQRTNYPITQDPEKRKYYNKLSFKWIKGWKHLKLPCGKCLGCLLDRGNMWALRVTLESKKWKNNCFITLTYNEKGHRTNGKRNLPTTKGGYSTLNQKDVQNFLKRLRKQYEGIEEWTNPITKRKEKPIRYFYCGEYGEKTKRPHYHIAIFNWCPNDLKFYKPSKKTMLPLFTSKKLEKLWTYGFCPVGNLTYESACYIARYVQKKAINPHPEQGDQEKEFIQMSRCPGIGAQEWEEQKEKYKKQGNIIINQNGVKAKPIPRYFMKLWEKENQEEFDKFKYKKSLEAEKREKEIEEQAKNYCEGKKLADTQDKVAIYFKDLLENLKVRTKNLKRNL